MIDFSKTLIRSSSVGYLMTEPQSKAAKDAGELSKTAKSHLLDVYIAEKYGRKRDIQTKQMPNQILGRRSVVRTEHHLVGSSQECRQATVEPHRNRTRRVLRGSYVGCRLPHGKHGSIRRHVDRIHHQSTHSEWVQQ